MRTLQLLTAASVVALLAGTPALAADQTMIDDNGNAVKVESNDTQMTKDMKAGWADTKAAVKKTADKADNAMSNKTDSARTDSAMNDKDEKYNVRIMGDAKVKTAAPVTIDKRMTAEGIIGKPVYNQQNDKVATVEDVILDSKGAAKLIVVKDGDFMGLGGKLAAFDYDAVVDRTKDGDVVMPITEKTIDKVAEFSYDPSDKKDIRVIPENGYSVKKILDGNLVDEAGKKLAAIDNVSLRDGRANLVIAAYDQTLGMGGDKVALNFDATRLVRDKDDVNLKLNADQADQFKSFEKTK